LMATSAFCDCEIDFFLMERLKDPFLDKKCINNVEGAKKFRSDISDWCLNQSSEKLFDTLCKLATVKDKTYIEFKQPM
ncbi:hypothetical protein, partial [Streptococcus pneumoniae]|uniref:hypothetical protein n=1 Tax=Streptococcus pneumoniae TaxID=1313 RepID=UPI0018B0D32E